MSRVVLGERLASTLPFSPSSGAEDEKEEADMDERFNVEFGSGEDLAVDRGANV